MARFLCRVPSNLALPDEIVEAANDVEATNQYALAHLSAPDSIQVEVGQLDNERTRLVTVNQTLAVTSNTTV